MDKVSLKLTAGPVVTRDKMMSKSVIHKNHALLSNFIYFISIAYDVNLYPTFSRYSLVSELQESTSPPPPPPPIDDT